MSDHIYNVFVSRGAATIYGPYISRREAAIDAMIGTDPKDEAALRAAGSGHLINVFTDDDLRTAKHYPSEIGYSKVAFRKGCKMHGGWRRWPFSCKSAEAARDVAASLSWFRAKGL